MSSYSLTVTGSVENEKRAFSVRIVAVPSSDRVAFGLTNATASDAAAGAAVFVSAADDAGAGGGADPDVDADAGACALAAGLGARLHAASATFMGHSDELRKYTLHVDGPL